MAKKKEKYEKLYFMKAPQGYGYHAGQVEDVPVSMAKEFKSQGFARAATQTLPDDLPGREAFIAGGIESIDEIKALEDPTEIKGIGDSTAKELAEYLTDGSSEGEE